MHHTWLAFIMSVLAATSTGFSFDGSSSDMAQQFYNLHLSGRSDAPSLTLSEIPDDLQKRLDGYSLTFSSLPPLLQRAVVWDTGYVAQYSNETYLATIYTPCKKSLSMADIALSLEDYQASGCPTLNCSNPTNSTGSPKTYRSHDCTSTQIEPESLCASSDVAGTRDSVMWATGGDNLTLPAPNVVRHDWYVPANKTGEHYLMFAIHMVSPEVKYEECPAVTAESAMIIPCVAYENSTKDDWCRPSTGALVDTWLSQQSPSDSGSSSKALIIGIAVSVVVLLVIIVAVWLCIRRKNQMKTFENTPRTYTSAATPNRSNQIEILVPTAALSTDNGPWSDPAITIFRIPREKVIVGKLVAQGGYGEVYRGTYKGTQVAVKMLRPALRNDMKQINAFIAEAKIMASIEHERLVPFVGVAWDSLRDLCVVTEFMEGGDLRSLLMQFSEQRGINSQGFNADKTKIAMHVAHALAYLHSLQPVMIHRDLKSRNILLDTEWNAKLTDFGISREASDQTMTAGVGTTLWMAPEVMMGERYDEKADIFSFGVVLTELDSHELPYTSVKYTNSGRTLPDTVILQQVAMGRLQAQFSNKAPQWLREMGTKCLSLDPRNRPRAAELQYELQTRAR